MSSDPIFDQAEVEINKHLKQYLNHLEAVNLKDALQCAMDLVQEGNSFIQGNRLDNKLAADEPQKAAAVTGIAINIVYLCASIFEPYLPATSISILEQLNAPFLLIPNRWTADSLKPGHKIGQAKHLFSLIDPKKEGEWRDMYGGTQAERLKKEEEAARKAANKAAAKARKAEKKTRQPVVQKANPSTSTGSRLKSSLFESEVTQIEKEPEQQNVEAKGTIGAGPAGGGQDPVSAVTDGVQHVTLPSS